MVGNLNFKNQGSNNFTLVSPQQSTRITQGSFNHVTTPVGHNNSNLISNLYNMNPNNQKSTSVGPTGM